MLQFYFEAEGRAGLTHCSAGKNRSAACLAALVSVLKDIPWHRKPPPPPPPQEVLAVLQEVVEKDVTGLTLQIGPFIPRINTGIRVQPFQSLIGHVGVNIPYKMGGRGQYNRGGWIPHLLL